MAVRIERGVRPGIVRFRKSMMMPSQVREPAALARHRFIKVDIIPDEVFRQSVDEGQLPTDWSRRITVTRVWGDRWLRVGETAILVVRLE